MATSKEAADSQMNEQHPDQRSNAIDLHHESPTNSVDDIHHFQALHQIRYESTDSLRSPDSIVCPPSFSLFPFHQLTCHFMFLCVLSTDSYPHYLLISCDFENRFHRNYRLILRSTTSSKTKRKHLNLQFIQPFASRKKQQHLLSLSSLELNLR